MEVLFVLIKYCVYVGLIVLLIRFLILVPRYLGEISESLMDMDEDEEEETENYYS